MIFTRPCSCSIDGVLVDCKQHKHSSTSSLHCTAPMQRTPQSWCKDCCVVWNLSRGGSERMANPAAIITGLPSFMLCFISPRARVAAVVFCQWPKSLGSKQPSPARTWRYLALPSCHQDISLGCQFWTYNTEKWDAVKSIYYINISVSPAIKAAVFNTKGKTTITTTTKELYASLCLYRPIFACFRTGVGVNLVIICEIFYSFSV